ncbi:uncharacterized protein [Eurosta solidaginis]|uniref:uncharacterized protein n=1 Tax=Eurosta solidaginis TaxID=178769 RepID=UPI00353068E0
MFSFAVVNKLFMLKLLLACISRLNAYDFGYYPSAEEFDNFVRETKRTWTRDLLANERRRAWTLKPPYRDPAGYFVPKYNENQVRRALMPTQATTKWPLYVKRLDRPTQDTRVDKPSLALSGNVIGSSLDFNMYEDVSQNDVAGIGVGEVDASILPEITLNELQQTHVAQASFNNQSTFSSFSRPSPQAAQSSASSTSVKQTLSSVIDNASTSESPPSAITLNTHRNDTQFPIFFSNPATGIVYAITEVGNFPTSSSISNNGSIPIFVSKQQYEHDLYALRNYYENKCHTVAQADANRLENPSSFSTTPHTATHPQIIRLQRPSTLPTSTKISQNKLTHASHNAPLPVLVQTELTIRNQSHFPTRKHKPNIKPKTKKMKPNRPGRKPVPTNATTQSDWPQIIRGVRVSTQKPQTSTETQQTLATQLEKPKSGSTDFKLSVKELTSAEQHHVRKRSVTNIRAYMEGATNVTGSTAYAKTQLSLSRFNVRQERASTRQFRPYAQQPLALSPLGNEEKEVSNTRPTLRMAARGHSVRARHPMLTNRTKSTHTSHTSAVNHTNWLLTQRSKQQANATHFEIRQNNRHLIVNPTQLPFVMHSPASVIARKMKAKHKRRKQKAAKVEKRGEFDIFDFDTDEDYDDEDEGDEKEKAGSTHRHKHKYAEEDEKNAEDDDADNNEDYDLDDEDDNTDSYEEDEDSYDDTEPTNKLLKQKKRKNDKKSNVSTTTEDYTADSTEQTTDYNKNSIVIDNGSSAEPSADYGAIESTENVLITPQTTATTTTTTTTKKPTIKTNKPSSQSTKTRSPPKKRIRRRPSSSSASYEDYDDDDSDDGGGIGVFFRMIFYPVQVVMNGIMDNMVGKESAEDEQYPYPTYTTYHNGIEQFERGGEDEDDAAAEEEEGEQSSSFTNWLSTLFGFNRRRKNIGSTTTYPPVPPPPPTRTPPTKAPSWFESLFGYGGKSTTASSILEDSNELDDKWFFGWFDPRPQRRRRKTTTTTTTMHTPPAQVPILTIVDPLKNPQNWIGILAHHIINSTATSVTQNPILNAIAAQATHNPEVPRKVTYDRYQIWRLKPLNDMQIHVLEEYKTSDDGTKLQWLKGPSLRGLTDVLVPPKQLLDFEASLNFESVAHEVLIYDVGKAIAYEQAQEEFHFNVAMRPYKNQKQSQKHQQQQPLIMSWHKYYEYDDIITHLEMLRMRHPQLIELIHIGRSYEGRPLVVVKIETKEHAASAATSQQAQLTQKKLKNKKKTNEANSVFIESGTHGLEWIGPATSLWMISELLRLIKSNKTTIDNEYIKNTTWYFMPILNPDGYVYSHKYDRFWRKTRSRHIARRTGIIDSAMTWLQQKKPTARVCYGVDLDRNWHYQWGKRGSSKWPCNELYAGPGPFSEPESKALSEFLVDYRKQIKLYISLQAYGQIISYPMKANISFNAERIDDFLDVAMVGTDGLRKQGSKSRYKIDSTNDLVEKRSGCSDAFAAYEVGIPFSFTIQLADNGVHGYLVPSASIEPTARDTFEIITGMIDYI